MLMTETDRCPNAYRILPDTAHCPNTGCRPARAGSRLRQTRSSGYYRHQHRGESPPCPTSPNPYARRPQFYESPPVYVYHQMALLAPGPQCLPAANPWPPTTCLLPQPPL